MNANASNVAFVTGASGGAAAGRLTARGAEVAAGDARSAHATEKRIVDAGEHAISPEVTEPGLGPVDRLAAGVFEWRKAEEVADDAFRSMLEVHVFGGRAALPGMRPRGRGANVNAASNGQALASRHSAAKGAVLSCAKALAGGKLPRGVNAVAPGPAGTPRGNPRESEKTVSERAKTMNRLAMPSEVAAGIAFLLSPDASRLTGRVMTVDGGEAMN